MGCFTLPEYGSWNGVDYDTKHGSPFDRGSADCYYGRPKDPHYYIGGSVVGLKQVDLTEEQQQAYLAGYQWQEMSGEKKDWG